MSAKAILSSKGQLVIPKSFRDRMGLHSGSELVLELKPNSSLEIYPIKKNINNFFGKGRNKTKGEVISIDEIDNAIGKAVIKNDRN